MNRAELSRVRNELLDLCLVPHNGALASGVPANNKFEAERLIPRPQTLKPTEYERVVQLRHKVMLAMGEIVVRHNPDVLVPIPEGANWIGFQLGNLFNKQVMYSTVSKKHGGTKEFILPPNAAEVMEGKRIALIDDVFTSGSSARKVMALMGVNQPASLITILDRSAVEARQQFEIPVESVFHDPIPFTITPESPYARYLAT